jgi:phenylacetate-CoA ligase
MKVYDTLYRHLLLPFFDGMIKGRQTVAHWKQAEVTQWSTRAQLEEFQVDSLRNLLIHAATTCPYYGDLWSSLGLNGATLQTLGDFHDWPLITRETIRVNRLAMRSTAAMKRMTKATGGSSGEPLQFDLDSGSNDRRTAMMWRGYNWAGGAPGTRQLYVWGTAVGQIPAWKRMKVKLHHRFDNHLVLSCFEFTPDKMRNHFDRMNRYRADVIVGYTNPLYEFARYIEREGLVPISPRSIIVGAERLHGFQRELIERVFQAPVFETYGSREFMLIGAECDKHSGLHLSMENLIVEVLDDDGTPTAPGCEGNVVITDLFNYGMPFVRYVNGDRAVAGFELCSCGRGLPLLKQVVGRQLDTLDTPDGRKIPGEFFPHLIKDFPAIRRFQVVQETIERITLKLVVDGRNLTVVDRDTLLSEIRKCTGSVVDVRLEMVEEIPLTKAGKLKVVVRTGSTDRPGGLAT